MRNMVASPSWIRSSLFHDRLNECKLFGVGATGHKFTWRGVIGHGGMHVFERLDMDISNDIWRLQFPDAFLRVLNRINYSEHHPILVSLYEDQQKSMAKEFKFECSWIMENSFKSMMLAAWKPDLGMLQNFEVVRDHTKSWNMHSVQSLLQDKKTIIHIIEGMQCKAHDVVRHAGL